MINFPEVHKMNQTCRLSRMRSPYRIGQHLPLLPLLAEDKGTGKGEGVSGDSGKTGKGRGSDLMERRKVYVCARSFTRLKESKPESIKTLHHGADRKRDGVMLEEEYLNSREVKRDMIVRLKLEIEGVMLNAVSVHA